MANGLINFLVIDDDENTRDFIETVLTEHNANFRVETAATGEECLERLSGQSYDLLVLDYKLPKMNGLEVMDAIKEKDMDMPVIMVTGRGNESVAAEALKKGVCDYITKGENLVDILPVVADRVLDEHRSKKNFRDIYEMFQKSLRSFAELDELLPLILKLAAAILETDSGSLMLLDEEKNELVVRASFGLKEEYANSFRLKMEERIAGVIARKKEPLLLVGGLEKYLEFCHVDPRPEIGSSLCIPIMVKEELLGILHLNRLSGLQNLDEKALAVLRGFVQDAAIAIKNILITDKLRSTQAQLIQSEKMALLGQIGAGVAHQLNSPLAGMASVISVLQGRLNKDSRPSKDIEKPQSVPHPQTYQERAVPGRNGALPNGEDNTTRELMRELSNAVEFCGTVMRDLLNFSRRAQAELEAVNLNKAVEGVLTFTAHELEMKKIKIEKKMRPDIPVVRAHMSELQQVVLNIIVNARDSMPDGGTLTIGTGIQEAKHACGAGPLGRDEGAVPPGRVEVEFTDTGRGISPEEKKRIFEPFFSTKEAGKGTGLGLSICSEIIKKYNGEIRVLSRPGRGSTFTVSLPAFQGGER